MIPLTIACNTLSYDAENCLVAAREPPANGGGTEQYVYDGEDRRVEKIASPGTTVYVYDAMGQLAAGAGILTIFSLLLFSLACRIRPSKITRFPGPFPEVFYTVETWADSGAISSDFTRVFAHFQHNGKSDRVMFLDGPYLNLRNVEWRGGNDATICIAEGRVNTFREGVSLHAGGAKYEIRNHLDPRCHAK